MSKSNKIFGGLVSLRMLLGSEAMSQLLLLMLVATGRRMAKSTRDGQPPLALGDGGCHCKSNRTQFPFNNCQKGILHWFDLII